MEIRIEDETLYEKSEFERLFSKDRTKEEEKPKVWNKVQIKDM